MRKLAGVICGISLLVAPALAQNPPSAPAQITTVPLNTGVAGTNHSTLTLPLTGNLALAANGGRRACIIQYRGSNTVSIATNAAMNDPLVLPAPSTNTVSIFQCGEFGITIGDPLYITGTAADTVVLWWQ